MSLSFAEGQRPSADDMERVLSSAEMAGSGVLVSHRSKDHEGRLELLAKGLTYELSGLAPAESAVIPDPKHRFGFSQDVPGPGEAISLLPGPHIISGEAIISVVRAMVGLSANLALQLSANAVSWHPARTWMDPRYFARIVVNWLTGGAFPALGITAVEQLSEGMVASHGLAFFTGQEVQVAAGSGEAPADTVKLTARIIDYMVQNGQLAEPRQLEGPNGEALLAEPSQYGNLVLIWRDIKA